MKYNGHWKDKIIIKYLNYYSLMLLVGSNIELDSFLSNTFTSWDSVISSHLSNMSPENKFVMFSSIESRIIKLCTNVGLKTNKYFYYLLCLNKPINIHVYNIYTFVCTCVIKIIILIANNL